MILSRHASVDRSVANAPAVLVERQDGTRTLLTKSDLLFSLLNAEKDRLAR